MQTHDSIHSTESHELAGTTIILALTGSVAVLRAIDLARLLIRHGARVVPVMSPAAATL
ncbi:MAG: bifunctional phosphopantothenoylcysteine decarboxylase/phosphopantothenate--cysteine ligase CoaBC, partial [Spirochaetaceae bacterium]